MCLVTLGREAGAGVCALGAGTEQVHRPLAPSLLGESASRGLEQEAWGILTVAALQYSDGAQGGRHFPPPPLNARGASLLGSHGGGRRPLFNLRAPNPFICSPRVQGHLR